MADDLNLSTSQARAGAQGPQAGRPRPGLGQGPLLRPRDQGPEVARRLEEDAGRLRGRPDAARHARAEAPRQHLRGRDADRPVPDVLAADQPARSRPRLRRRRHGQHRGDGREGPAEEHEGRREGARHRRAEEEARRHRPLLLRQRAREDHGRRRQRDRAQGAEGSAQEEAQGREAEARGGRARGRPRPTSPSPRPRSQPPRPRLPPRTRRCSAGSRTPGASRSSAAASSSRR